MQVLIIVHIKIRKFMQINMMLSSQSGSSFYILYFLVHSSSKIGVEIDFMKNQVAVSAQNIPLGNLMYEAKVLRGLSQISAGCVNMYLRAFH